MATPVLGPSLLCLLGLMQCTLHMLREVSGEVHRQQARSLDPSTLRRDGTLGGLEAGHGYLYL